MGNFPILLLSALTEAAVGAGASSSVQSLTVVSHVTANLLPVLEAKEVTPVPLASVCDALASRTGLDGRPVIPIGARLLNVGIPEDEIADAVLEGLTLSFAGSGLKLGKDLVLLTSRLTWVSQENVQLMVATFEHGPFLGFFDSRTQHVRERLLFGVSGAQVCVVPG